MAKLAKPYETAEAVNPKDVMGYIDLKVVTHIEFPIMRALDGGSIGSLVDAHLADCVHDGMQVEEFTLSIKPEAWKDVVAGVTRY